MPATNNNSNSSNSSYDGDSGDDVPALIGRDGQVVSDNSDTASSGSFEDDIHADDNDDDDDLPELMCRFNYQSDSSSNSSNNDSIADDASDAEDDDGDGSVPSLVANYQQSASDSNGSDSDDDNDNNEEEEDSIPDLVDRNQDHYDSSHDSDSDWEDRRHERSRDAVPAPSQPTPQQPRAAKQSQQPQQPQRRAQQRQQQQQQQQSSSLYPYQEQATRVAYWGDLIEKATAMRVGDLKDALRDMDSSLVASSSRTAAMEKSELVLEYARLRLLQDPVPHSPGTDVQLEKADKKFNQILRTLPDGSISQETADRVRQMLLEEFNVTPPPECDSRECSYLFVHLGMQRQKQQWRQKNIAAPTPLQELEVLPFETQRSAFGLRQLLRRNYFFPSTGHCQTLRQLTRAFVYAQRQHRLDTYNNNFRYWGLHQDTARTTPYSVPTAVPAKNPSARGTWVLAAPNPHDPQQQQRQYKLSYAWTDGKTICKSSDVYTTLDLDAGDQLVPAPTPGTVWVYYSRRPQQPSTTTTDRETTTATTAPSLCTFAIDQFRCELSTLRIPMYRNLPQATQLVTNGQDGVWMLVECSDNNNNCDYNEKWAQLVLYDRDHRNGHFTGWHVPHHPSTRIFPDVVHGGVWLWVVVEFKLCPAPEEFIVRPGLYYVSSVTGRLARLSSIKDTDTRILLASDSVRQGLWLFGPAGDDDTSSSNSASTRRSYCSRLVHVAPPPPIEDDWKLVLRQQLINAQLDQVQSILDDGTTTDGALLHYKKESGWKLMRAVLGQSELVEQYKCPKNAKIATTGVGVAGVWVLKKTGRGLHWGLQYLHPTETVEESTEKYVANSILGGGVVGAPASSG